LWEDYLWELYPLSEDSSGEDEKRALLWTLLLWLIEELMYNTIVFKYAFYEFKTESSQSSVCD
jgi:hypothetical protein